MRIPRTRYPLTTERAYARDGQQAVKRMRDITLLFLESELKDVLNRTVNDSDLIKDDAIDWLDELIEKLRQLIIGTLTNGDAQEMASRYLKAINNFNQANIGAQIAAVTKIRAVKTLPTGLPTVMAVNPLVGNKSLDTYVKTKIKENVSYIQGIRDSYAKKVEQIIYRGVTEGQSYGQVGAEIKKTAGMSMKHASFIARDQSGTIYGQMTKARHKAAGINHFIWRGMLDERERQSHLAREGNVYNYDTADLLPGEDFNCRCTADPAFDEDLDDA